MSWGQDIEPFDWTFSLKVIAIVFGVIGLTFLIAGCGTIGDRKCYPGNMACMSAEEIVERLGG